MRSTSNTIWAVFGLALILLLPAFAGGQWVKIFTSTTTFAMAAAGAGFLYTRLGMVSLVQVGLMGVGGWVTLRLNHAFNFPFEINLMVAGAVTMFLGNLIALPALRMRGLYLALITLMFAAGLDIVFTAKQFPNGADGFWGVGTTFAAEMRRPIFAQSDAAYLRYTMLWLVIGFVLIELHRRMAPGRAWALIRKSEAAALASGVNVTLYKTWAFGLSGLLAGLGGGLLAGSLGLLDAATFRASESVMLFALVIVGGARFWYGAVISAVLFRVVPGLLNNWGVDADLSLVIFGAALLHAVMSAPDGLAGQINGAVRALFSGRKSPENKGAKA
ncbi:branched-chain amino acid ABC transporter permease [Celeribacter litoreus]|uniref:branched-chain amino acid ABC transporter permease n=1 Tax=Celeribacter litoreus TaxID=2876714 RepID=UPI001CCF6B3C|nr:branched-chain amino acid ABC transporter permease [Celeribacter litoreus]MCA0044839.1 branched-chain amino acid ABC transporter permease [Celeribacter litoreus]